MNVPLALAVKVNSMLANLIHLFNIIGYEIQFVNFVSIRKGRKLHGLRQLRKSADKAQT